VNETTRGSGAMDMFRGGKGRTDADRTLSLCLAVTLGLIVLAVVLAWALLRLVVRLVAWWLRRRRARRRRRPPPAAVTSGGPACPRCGSLPHLRRAGRGACGRCGSAPVAA